MLRDRILLVLLLLCAPPAFAKEAKPPEIEPFIHATASYGTGSYTWMGLHVYDASLWTDAAHWSVDAPFALTLSYHMHFTAKEIAARSISEMRSIAPLDPEQAAGFNAQLTRLFHEVHDGDRITALYAPRKGAEIFYDGKRTGTISDDFMARRFLDIWLSEKTSAPDLRKQLLSANR